MLDHSESYQAFRTRRSLPYVPAFPPNIMEAIFEQFLALLPDRVVHQILCAATSLASPIG